LKVISILVFFIIIYVIYFRSDGSYSGGV
jgi:hypothetical protein